MCSFRAGMARLFILPLVFATAFSQEQTPANDKTASLTGALPNGVHYIVVPHASPKGDIGLRLVVQAGSLDERDDERGFAHFVEHLAFAGTIHHPPGTIRVLFQNLGLTFGADLNAFTSYTHTDYIIDLPAGREDHLDETLGVLRDDADGLLFLPAEVKRESSVVLSELGARDSEGRRAHNELTKVLFAGTRVPDREVGGIATLIKGATADHLRAFYQRNYRPERMTVVLAGPVDAESAVKKIAAAFASMPAASTPPPAELAPVIPAPTGVKPNIIVSPTNQGTDLQLVSVGARPADTAAGRREELMARIATAALYTRIHDRLASEDLAKFGSPTVTYEAIPFGRAVQHTIQLPGTADGWSDGVRIVETELRRARSLGFTAAEIQEAANGQRNAAQTRRRLWPNLPGARVAGEIAREVADDRSWLTPGAQLAETIENIKNLDAAEVGRNLNANFPSDSLHLILIVASENAVKPDRLLAAYHRSAGRALATKAEGADLAKFHYGDFGPAGRVVQASRVEDLDATLTKFANGVELNIRPSQLEPRRFRLRIIFHANYTTVPINRGGIAELAGYMLLNADLRHQPLTEITRLLKQHELAPQLNVTSGTPALSIAGPVTSLPFALQYLTALLTDYSYDIDHYRVAMSKYNGEHHNTMVTPATLAFRAALRGYTDDARVVLNPPEVFGSEKSSEDAEEWLRNYILKAPLELGLVGDFEAEQVVAAAASSVGTLPSGRTPWMGTRIAAPKKMLRQESRANLPATISASCVLWPVNLPDDVRENAALALATDVLRDRLIIVLRDAMGATYSPQAWVFRDAWQRDFAYVGMTNTFLPADAERLTLSGLSIAATLAKNGIFPEELKRLREPARTRREQDLQSNIWWVSRLATAQSRPEVLDEMRHHATIVDELTAQDINAAAQVFRPERFVSFVLHPTSANVPLPNASAIKK